MTNPPFSRAPYRICPPSGAQVTFAAAVALPPSFVLEIPSLDLQVEARVVWSRAGQHGVTLVWPQRTPWA